MSSPTTEAPKPETRPKLPEGWRWVRLGEISEVIAGQSPPSATYRKAPEGLPFFQGKADFGERHPVATVWCTSPKKTAEAGDILISVRAPVGPTNIADQRCCIGRGLAAIRVGGLADRDFILWAIRRFEAEIAKRGSGSTFDSLPVDELRNFPIPLPPLETQRRIAAILTEQMGAVEKARKAAEEGLEAASGLVEAIIRESLRSTQVRDIKLSGGLKEAVQRVGANWQQFPVLGATREGLSPAKEGVGKNPQGYKLVTPESVFYNPMRITIGSIAMVDTFDNPGITSPDYVVLKGINGVIHHRWFYYWLRSFPGQAFIRSMARGAVRERLLFNRLKEGTIRIPDWETQIRASEQLAHIPALRTKIQAQLEAIRALPAAILRRAFSGEL